MLIEIRFILRPWQIRTSIFAEKFSSVLVTVMEIFGNSLYCLKNIQDIVIGFLFFADNNRKIFLLFLYTF